MAITELSESHASAAYLKVGDLVRCHGGFFNRMQRSLLGARFNQHWIEIV